MSDKSISIQYYPFAEEQDKSKPMEAGRFLWPGFTRLYEVAYRQVGSRVRYFTGLEAADYPEDEREEIVKAKESLEQAFGKDMLDPHNEAFWKTINLEITRNTTFLNLDDPKDLLTYYLIKGGGYREIAPNYETCITAASPRRWYLIDATQYAEIGAQDDRSINKAIAALETLEDEKGFDDMYLVHKVLISSDRGITRKSPKVMMYKDLSDFIHGRIVKTNKRQTPKQFLESVDLLKKDKKKLFVTAYVKDANYYNFLTLTDDNQLKNLQTGTKYGSTVDRAIAYLCSPANQSELDNIKERVEIKWNE